MQYFIFKVGEEGYKHPHAKTLKQWVLNLVILDKLQSPLGFLMMCLVSLAFSFWIATSTLTGAWLILLNVILVPCLLGAMLNQRFGLTLLLLIAFGSELFYRYAPEVPIDAYRDAMVWVMLFGILVRQTLERNWQFLRNPVSAVLLVWLGYNLLQAANPIAPNLGAWAEAVRYSGVMLLLYFVGLYTWHERKHLYQFLYLWIVLVTLAAIYGLYQAWAGLPAIEREWLMGSQERFQTFYTLNSLRVFSIFSNPSTFGISLATTSLLSLAIVLGADLRPGPRILLGISIGIMVLTMVYTSTRTAYVVLLAGLCFLALLRPERKFLAATGIILLIALLLALVPAEHAFLQNFQSAFHPEESFSYQTQMENLTYVQPYIQKHAMGAGMGTTGAIGQLHAPYTMLAEFPAASGFVRIALEMGWVGLGLFLGLIGSVLWIGVRRYFRESITASRPLYQAFLTLLLMLVLANYLEPVLLRFPTNMLFILGMAGLLKLRELGEPQT